MTEQEAVQEVYRWALAANADIKAGMVLAYCGSQCVKAIESHDDYRQAYLALVVLCDEWQARSKPGARSPDWPYKPSKAPHGLQKALTIVGAILDQVEQPV